MKRIMIIASIAIAVIGAAVICILVIFKPGSEEGFRYVKLSRGDICNTVTCTGALEFYSKQDVAVLASGIVSGIYADFNARVKKGQLLAAIDDTLSRLAVSESEAALEKAESDFRKAESDLEDTEELFAKSFKSEAELDASRNAFESADAAVKTARIAREKAQIQLGYFRITAPVSGVIVARNIEVGQQVSSASGTPAFVIAADTSLMQALASVDESDISKVKKGQAVTFSVQAYQDESFEGKVSQTRLVPQVVQNVVNYTVVVDVYNKEGKLLPGMTATMDIVIDEKKDVLRAPVASLRFQATREMFRAAFSGRDELKGSDSKGRGFRNNSEEISAGGGGGRNSFEGTGRRNGNILWVLDESSGDVKPVRVSTGITDGQWTEVISDTLEDGMQVVSAVTARNRLTSGSSQGRNPFQQNRGVFFPGPR